MEVPLGKLQTCMGGAVSTPVKHVDTATGAPREPGAMAAHAVRAATRNGRLSLMELEIEKLELTDTVAEFVSWWRDLESAPAAANCPSHAATGVAGDAAAGPARRMQWMGMGSLESDGEGGEGEELPAPAMPHAERQRQFAQLVDDMKQLLAGAAEPMGADTAEAMRQKLEALECVRELENGEWHARTEQLEKRVEAEAAAILRLTARKWKAEKELNTLRAQLETETKKRVEAVQEIEFFEEQLNVLQHKVESLPWDADGNAPASPAVPPASAVPAHVAKSEREATGVASPKTRLRNAVWKWKLVTQRSQLERKTSEDLAAQRAELEREFADKSSEHAERARLLEEELNVLKEELEAMVAERTEKEAEWRARVEERDVQLASSEQLYMDTVTTYEREMKKRKELYNELQELRGNIRVFCRVRPMLRGESAAGEESAIETGSKDNLVINRCGQRKKFEYDRVYAPDATQEQVFADTEPIITSVCDGYNACIFAYGQTGSGKTFTMQGTPENRGVNSRALDALFALMDERKAAVQYRLKMSVIEIYNEQIRDLLATGDTAAKKPEIRMSATGKSSYVSNVQRVQVESSDAVMDWLKKAEKNRSVGCTNMNEHSSRSHLLLTIQVRGENVMTGVSTAGKLHLIDLAGSERVSKSAATGDRLKEAQYINKSLLALGDVINALQHKNSHIPYRNSKLTHLLQDSLGGHAKTLMFVNVSPIASSADESISSLKFATKARATQLGAAKKHADSEGVSRMKKELKELTKSLSNVQGTAQEKETRIASLKRKISELKVDLHSANDAVGEKDKLITSLRQAISVHQQAVVEKDARIHALEEAKKAGEDSFQSELRHMERDILALRERAEQSGASEVVAALKSTVAEKTATISSLMAKVRKLEAKAISSHHRAAEGVEEGAVEEAAAEVEEDVAEDEAETEADNEAVAVAEAEVAVQAESEEATTATTTAVRKRSALAVPSTPSAPTVKKVKHVHFKDATPQSHRKRKGGHHPSTHSHKVAASPHVSSAKRPRKKKAKKDREAAARAAKLAEWRARKAAQQSSGGGSVGRSGSSKIKDAMERMNHNKSLSAPSNLKDLIEQAKRKNKAKSSSTSAAASTSSSSAAAGTGTVAVAVGSVRKAKASSSVLPTGITTNSSLSEYFAVAAQENKQQVTVDHAPQQQQHKPAEKLAAAGATPKASKKRRAKDSSKGGAEKRAKEAVSGGARRVPLAQKK